MAQFYSRCMAAILAVFWTHFEVRLHGNVLGARIHIHLDPVCVEETLSNYYWTPQLLQSWQAIASEVIIECSLFPLFITYSKIGKMDGKYAVGRSGRKEFVSSTRRDKL